MKKLLFLILCIVLPYLSFAQEADYVSIITTVQDTRKPSYGIFIYSNMNSKYSSLNGLLFGFSANYLTEFNGLSAGAYFGMKRINGASSGLMSETDVFNGLNVGILSKANKFRGVNLLGIGGGSDTVFGMEIATVLLHGKLIKGALMGLMSVEVEQLEGVSVGGVSNIGNI